MLLEFFMLTIFANKDFPLLLYCIARNISFHIIVLLSGQEVWEKHRRHDNFYPFTARIYTVFCLRSGCVYKRFRKPDDSEDELLDDGGK